MHAHVCSALYWYQLWGNNDLCVNPTSVDMAEEANEWYDSVALHCRKDVSAHGIMNWNMVWKIDWTGECIQLHVTGTAQCTLNYLAYLECCHLTAGALCMSKSGIVNRILIQGGHIRIGHWLQLPSSQMWWRGALAVHPNRKLAQYVCAGICHGYSITIRHSSYLFIEIWSLQWNMVKWWRGTLARSERRRGYWVHSSILSFRRSMSAHLGSFWRLTQENGDLSSTSPPHVETVDCKRTMLFSYVTVDDITTRVLKLGRGAVPALDGSTKTVWRIVQ